MKCLYCKGTTRVTNSRPQKRSNAIWRRRKCLQCGNVVSTTESINYESALRVRLKSGKLVVFDPYVLLISVYDSLKHRPTPVKDASALTQTIISQLVAKSQAIISTQEIAQNTKLTLENFDKVAFVHYDAFYGK